MLGLSPSLASDRSAATGFYTGDVKVKTRDAGTFVHPDQPLDLRKSKLLIDNADATSGLTGQVRFKGRIDSGPTAPRSGSRATASPAPPTPPSTRSARASSS
ncbi:MAG: hypothetical protein AAGB29_12515 [Planctomycetota bacterium]